MKKSIEGLRFDQERALYHLTDAHVCDCLFAGPADGESALKEASNIRVENCDFSLRYPLWHVKDFSLIDSRMDENTRAAIWYGVNGRISDCDLNGIKALRECDAISLTNCNITSAEFGWKCSNIYIHDSKVESEYLFLDSRNIKLEHVQQKGKYSFQYVQGLQISNCFLNTKDAFWHSKNVTVVDSVLRGEYLGWYSENLTLIGCKIIGTQPLCYCKNLKLQNCTMEDCDLAFEYSDVDATIDSYVDSIKNPRSGKIVVEDVGEVILEDAVMECNAKITLKNG